MDPDIFRHDRLYTEGVDIALRKEADSLRDVFDLWSTFDFGARCKVLVGNRHSTFTQLMFARACYAGGACPRFANFADSNSLFS